jgi:uncharacterized protein
VAASDACLTPNAAQRTFIEAVERPLVPLQGPPGTGKTSGATAPALLARAAARARSGRSFTGVVVAPAHEAVDAVLDGVVETLANWPETAPPLDTLELVRVLPSDPATRDRAATQTERVEVTYCNYHSEDGDRTLRRLATELADTAPASEPPTHHLLFVTPSTLYRVLGIAAETLAAIDGTSAPAAMRYDPGLADVVCVDEASMLDLGQLFVATSPLKPTGQTLLVGDHRQLATVTAVEWADTLRKPLERTQAYRSALEYIQWLNATETRDRAPPGPPFPDGGAEQTTVTQFLDAESHDGARR